MHHSELYNFTSAYQSLPIIRKLEDKYPTKSFSLTVSKMPEYLGKLVISMRDKETGAIIGYVKKQRL